MHEKLTVAGLNIHPLKSGRAIALDGVDVHLDGFRGDRRFMLVDTDGRFITQRELQPLARVVATASGNTVHLSKDGEALTVTFDPARRMRVTVWDDSVDAAIACDADNRVLSGWFGREVKLAYMDEQSRRTTGTDWAAAASPVGFADGFAILVTTTGSLYDLNRTLVEKGDAPVGMDRFRTNILVDCDEPWAEDRWESISIAGIIFDFVKPCARCIMTTQDQTTGERIGGNPIAGLAQKRMSADRRVPGVLFGWNAVPRGTGRIALSDTVSVSTSRLETWPMKQR